MRADIDKLENSVVLFNDELAKEIKNNIRVQLQGVQGSTEHMEGWNRGQFLLGAAKLTGLELKRLHDYIEDLKKTAVDGRITNPAYAMIGGDALATFVNRELERLRKVINAEAANEEELGKTEKQDIKPAKPPDFEGTTGIPKVGNLFGKHSELSEQVQRIKQLIQH